MSESTQSETQLGLADLKNRFSAARLNIIEQRERFHHDTAYFAIGTPTNQTDIVLSRDFIDDLPNTKEYQATVDSYARAVAGRLKCGSPELFYCRCGVAVRVSIRWPIQAAVYNSVATTFILMDVINKVDGQIAKCSMEVGFAFGHTVFDIVAQTVNSVRTAIDAGLVGFCSPDVRQEKYQRIGRQQQPSERHSQSEIEQFLTGKAYVLGFLAADEPGDMWAADPWDALYLGVSKKELLLAMRVLRAKGLLRSDASSEYAQPTDKLLAMQSSEKEGEETFFKVQQKVSRLSLPNKEALLSHTRTALERHSVAALLVIDLDNFKSVNDLLKSHSEGDACLDRVVNTIGTVVARKGQIYRWGSGDEFAVLLPDFSTEEAQATAERIRSAVERAKPGGDVGVTTSIGVCSSDRTKTTSAEEFLGFADKAMYKSKEEGRNRVTTWPIEIDSVLPVAAAERQPKRAIKAQLARFLKEGREIQNGLHYSDIDSLRQKQEWEKRVEEFLEKNLDGSYAVRFQNPTHQLTSSPAGISLKMIDPWRDTGAKMAMLNDFMSELRD